VTSGRNPEVEQAAHTAGRILREGVLWGLAAAVAAVLLEMLVRWRLPDYAADPIAEVITGLMLVWLGIVVGITVTRLGYEAKRATPPAAGDIPAAQVVLHTAPTAPTEEKP
jgi:hypothetical protein